MSIEALQIGSFFVNILMALIAIIASLISYAIYADNSNPEIIVYLEQDKDVKQVLNLVIKNIGKGAAHEIKFNIRGKIPQRAMTNSDIQEMTQGALITGIPFLAPSSDRSMMFGKFHELRKWFGNEKVRIDITYRRSKNIFLYSKELKSSSYMEVFSFSHVSAADNSIGNKISKEISKISKEISNINTSIANKK
ncbi:hypothetical protein [Gibbsiella quercinecans]|uniref:hypothetical protein n=1 Tax=Gibbsiella quercinecans TaxID=929813 RepID=UPI003A4E1B08